MNTFVNPLTTYHFLSADDIVGVLLGYAGALAIVVATAIALVKLVEFLDNWRFERNLRRDRISRFRAYKRLGRIQYRRRAMFGRRERED